jgi:hypothetical protein
MKNIAFLLGSFLLVLFVFCMGVFIGIFYCCKLGVESIYSRLKRLKKEK